MNTYLRIAYLTFQLARTPSHTALAFEIGKLTRMKLKKSGIQRASLRLLEDPDFRSMVEKRESSLFLQSYDLHFLSTLEPGTLGHQYSVFLRQNKLMPESFQSIPINDVLDFFAMRMRKTHDVWHVLTGFETHPLGEMGLMAFSFAQVPSPFSFCIILSGYLHYVFKRDLRGIRAAMKCTYSGFRMGRKAKKIFGIVWEDHWENSLESVRRRYQIRPYFQS